MNLAFQRDISISLGLIWPAAEFPARRERERENDRGGWRTARILLLERRLGGVIRYLACYLARTGKLNEAAAIMSRARGPHLVRRAPGLPYHYSLEMGEGGWKRSIEIRTVGTVNLRGIPIGLDIEAMHKYRDNH